MLELLLVREERVLLRLPLGRARAPAASLDEREVGQLSDYYAIASNPKRLRVMLELANGVEMRFSDVMKIVMNPKLVQDCLQPLLREGLVRHGARGSAYSASPRGLAFGATMYLGAGRILDVLEKELGEGP